MSACGGEVIRGGKIVGYFKYEGISDSCRPNIYKTLLDLEVNWGNPKYVKCECKKEPVGVILWTSYGLRNHGFFWAAEACLDCGVVLNNLCPYEGGLTPANGYPLEKHDAN